MSFIARCPPRVARRRSILMQHRRWQRTALWAVVLAWPCAAHAAWPTYANGPEHPGQSADTLSPPLAVLWKYASRPYQDTAIGTASAIVNTGSPITTNDTVYFASKDRVYALDKESGGERWHWPTGEEVSPTIRSTPALGDGILYVGAMDGSLYALDTNTGSQLWSVKTGSAIRSHPLVYKEAASDPGTVYFGSDDDYLYAIDARTGEVKWKYRATDDIISAPCYYDGLVIFNSADSQIHAVNASTGKVRWVQRTAVPAIGISPVIYSNRVFLAAGTNLYSFRVKGGVPQTIQLYDPATRQNPLAGDITTTPIITDDPNGTGGPTSGLVFLGDRGGFFYCFQLNGKLRWKTQKLDDRTVTMPVLAGKWAANAPPPTIYVGANKGFIYGLNADTGQITWRYRAEAPRDYQVRYAFFNISAPLVVDEGKLLVLGDDGTLNVFAADATDVTPPTITGPKPDRGTTLNGSPPLTISAYLWDEGSGINTDTVAVYLDGQLMETSKDPYDKKGSAVKVGVVYDPVKRTVEYNTAPTVAGQKATALPDGHHAVKVEAADWRGNVGTLEWTFVVDNKLPPRPRRQPATNTTGQPGSTGSRSGPGGYGPPGSTGPPGSYGNRSGTTPRVRNPRQRRR
jgi:outer membrane protein assembly factor BamB